MTKIAPLLALLLLALPARAQVTFPSPNGANAPGAVGMCLNSAGRYVPVGPACVNALPVTGAATIADGADVSQGAKADAACGSDTGTCTEIALLKRQLQSLTALIAALPAQGLLRYTLEPAASDNHTTIKDGSGVFYHVNAFNNSATVNYYRLYNAGAGFNGCGSASNLLWEGQIPASTSGAGFVENISAGVAFSSGLSICVTGSYGQTSTTAATPSAISLNVGYR